ncbi:MAG TPA: hypothetical protein VHA57_12595 [Actinomycetota bacterium]|nr:hypothetical protein [Actinomycetota bacterium]
MAETAVTPLQEEVLQSITTFEDATVKVAKSWAKTLTTSPSNGELFTAPKLDNYYSFFERLWGVQRDFIVNLLEVATEAGKTVPDQVKRTAERVGATAGVK